MGLIERIQERRAGQRTERRVIGGIPWRPWDSPYWKFPTGGPVHPSRAFYGTEHALGLPALYSCVRLLSESLASLPLRSTPARMTGVLPSATMARLFLTGPPRTERFTTGSSS